MTTPQIIILIGISIIAIIAFYGVMIHDKYEKRIIYAYLSFFTCGALFVIAIVSIAEMNKYYDVVKGKCPEYERIDNVYKLK